VPVFPYHLRNDLSLLIPPSVIGAWEACNASRSESATVADRLSLWGGLCCVLATMAEDQKLAAFESLAACALNSLETTIAEVRGMDPAMIPENKLSRLADDISLLACLPRVLVSSGPSANDVMQSGCDTTSDAHANIPENLLVVVRRGWPCIMFAAEKLSQDEVRRPCLLLLVPRIALPALTRTLFFNLPFAI